MKSEVIKMQKLRVGVRGITGNFAWNLACNIRKERGIELAAGIARNDPSLKRLLAVIGSQHGKERERILRVLPKTMVLEEDNGNGLRTKVSEINSSQQFFKFIPACDFDPSSMCDIFVDLTRGANKPFEVQYSGFIENNPLLVVLDTGKSESFRGRLIAPPFVEPENPKHHKNVWRLGDCVVTAVASILNGMEKYLTEKIRKIGLTVFCILDSRTSDNMILPERAHALYFNAPPADLVRGCIRDDLKTIFSRSMIESPVMIQAHGLEYYALVLKVDVEGVKLDREEVIRMVTENGNVFLAPQSMNSTFDLAWEIRRKMLQIGSATAPIIPFERAIEVEQNASGTSVSIQAAVHYMGIGPVMFVQALKMLNEETG